MITAEKRRDRADREIDSAAGDHQCHAHGQHHEDGRILQDDHDVVQTEETRIRKCHDQA